MVFVHTTSQKPRVLTYNTSLFGPATFQVLSSIVWLTATLLDKTVLTIAIAFPAGLIPSTLSQMVDSLTLFTIYCWITIYQAL